MIILEIVIFVIMLLMIISSYWKLTELDKYNTELEDRMLQLEKRIESYNKKTNDRISMEIGQRQLLEELTNDEIANIHKQMIKLNKKKKSDKE